MKAKGSKSVLVEPAAQQVETVPVDRLIPYARNARTHSDAQVAQIAASIREFGFCNPVLIDAGDGIIAGHGRVLAARKLGMEAVPCLRLSHLTETQRRAYVIADNKLALNAGWDSELLALELTDLKAFDFDLEVLGFEVAELDGIFAEADSTPDGKTDPDEAPEPPADPVTAPGDLWLLGNHRLMCGDSTDAGSVGLLMNGKRAVLMQTDPPYGVAYDNSERPNPGVAKPRVANDEVTDGPKMQAFLERCLLAMQETIAPHAAYYFWHPMLTQGTYVAAAAAAAAGILIHRQIILVKPVLLLGRGDYHWKHELCFYGWKQGSRPPFYGPRNQHTIWEIGNVNQAERKEFNHATPKPVDIWIAPIENHTKPGEVMLEPFSGSGSQIIAAEKTGRCCYAMELAAPYVDVAVKRWQAFTGKQARLDGDGRTFDEIAQARPPRSNLSDTET
jgi:ParB-like chromosome segregation protein Spo0J